MRVQDFKGDEIKVGSKVKYGDEAIAEVISISDPDIYSHDDEYGVERVDGYMVEISIRFDDDGSEETLKAGISLPPGPLSEAEKYEETFEESGDLEVIA